MSTADNAVISTATATDNAAVAVPQHQQQRDVCIIVDDVDDANDAQSAVDLMKVKKDRLCSIEDSNKRSKEIQRRRCVAQMQVQQDKHSLLEAFRKLLSSPFVKSLSSSYTAAADKPETPPQRASHWEVMYWLEEVADYEWHEKMDAAALAEREKKVSV